MSSNKFYMAATIETSVDGVYDAMSEGERQHMTNKLYKHGYVSPKATKDFSSFADEDTAEDVVEKLSHFMSMGLLVSTIQKKFPATVARVVFESMVKGERA